MQSFCQVLQYADDLVLYVSAPSTTYASDKLNAALSYLEQWLTAHGLSLAIPKSSAVVFTKKRQVPCGSRDSLCWGNYSSEGRGKISWCNFG